MKIFLDDERSCPPGFILIKTAEDLITFVESNSNQIICISLDHDLGEGQEDGYEVLLWLEQKVYWNPSFKIPEITIHSDNGPGRANMMRALESIKRIRQAQEQE